MQTFFLRILEALFPIQRHEWPKVAMLLSTATFLGIGASVSRAAAEALFLTRLGVDFLPYVYLVNPVLVVIVTTIYGVFAGRVSNARMMIYTALFPIPLILLLRFVITFDMTWAYFVLYMFVLAYASVLSTSWAVYLPGHYDVQEGKRILPFVSSGLLIGSIIGGFGVAFCAPLIGAANVLFVWIGALLGAIVVVQSIATLFTAMDAEARKVKRSGAKVGVLDNFKEGVAYSRSSALFLTTAVASIATMMALQLIDFEYSKIFARRYPQSNELTAFLGAVDGLTTIAALMFQWFVVPRFIRNIGVQGTNLLFPCVLTGAFGGMLVSPGLGSAIFARFTRASLMPSLRGTTRTLILNAVPRKKGALVRSFNTGIVMPMGQGAGALTLLLLKGLNIALLFPVLGFVISTLYIFYTYRQNRAYGEALLELLQEDKIHLLDLEDDELRQLDATAVAAISTRLQSDEEDVALAAVELLRSIGSAPAVAALQQQLPYPTPAVTAAALQALAAMRPTMTPVLQPYLNDPQPQVRMAALAGLRHLGDTTLQQRAVALLDDQDVQVRAAALAVVLADPAGASYERALQLWEAMLAAAETDTLIAALRVIPSVPETSLQGHVYHALDHQDMAVRHTALEVLEDLAAAQRITEIDSALARALEDEDVDIRHQALQVVIALGSDDALEHMLVLLDDEQPRIRETLINALKLFGKRAFEPLFIRLRSPRTSLMAKESALLALARMDGVQADQFLNFWEAELHDVYRYKLMLACLEEHTPLDADTFLQLALRNAHDQTLSLLVQLLAVWTSPEVARLVESGLHDPDRSKRANALEALESLGERRFTQLLLPILEAEDSPQNAWRGVAERRWHLMVEDIPMVIKICLKSTNKWLLIGALLSAQARAADLGDDWRTQLSELATSAPDADVRHTAQRLAGQEAAVAQHTLSLTDVMLFLKRIPLYSSMTLGQLQTIATHLTEKEMQRGDIIFREGDARYELYLIVSGKVDIVQRRGDTAQTLVTLPAGEFFGDMAIFEDRPRSADAVAVEQGMLLVLSPERFRQIIMQEPAISFEIFRELSARIRRFDIATAEAAHQQGTEDGGSRIEDRGSK